MSIQGFCPLLVVCCFDMVVWVPINPWSDRWFAIFFSDSIDWLFMLSIVSFRVQMVLVWCSSTCFCFHCLCFGAISETSLPRPVCLGMPFLWFFLQFYSLGSFRIICRSSSSSTHSSVAGYLCSFHVLAVINGAAVNSGVPVSFQIRVFILSTQMSGSGIARSYGSCVVSFLGNLYTGFHSGCTCLHSH